MPQNTGVGIYNFIAVTLEIIVDFFELICSLFVLLRMGVRRSYDFCCSRTVMQKRERKIFERCHSLLTKKPHHIAVIVGPTARLMDKELYERLFRYALQMDISCISLYDTRPDVDRKECSSLLGQVTTQSDVHLEHISKNHYRWTITKPKAVNGKKVHKTESNGHIKNGHVHNGTTQPHRQECEKALEIFEFSTHDNLEPIAKVCRVLFGRRETPEMQLMLINNRKQLMDSIDKELTKLLFGDISEMADFHSEPELCIIFNAFLCTYRMLPWHTRFTELYNFKTGWELDADAFADVLYRYSRCEQRWGK